MQPPELSIVVPTFNEALNVGPLVERISAAMIDIDWEVIFVDDDSPDGTADAVRALAQSNRRVRCVQRLGRRGLSSACIEGMLASSAPFLAVMDADLQHDERLLPQMLDLLRADEADLAIGSRYVEGGSSGNFPDDRVAISRMATRLALAATRVNVADPMSGFFMLKAPLFRACVRDLSATGFKILLDLLASAPNDIRVRELPYRFGERNAGSSKLDTKAAWDYLALLLDKTVGRYIPTRFIVFSAVGALGVGVHMAVLALLFKTGTTTFAWGQGWATLTAMTFNFALNNAVTYRDRKLRGLAWLRGWASFVLACSVGAIANIGIAEFLFEQNVELWALSALAGIVISAVWNYAVTAIYTWHAA
ncbi:MAG TPA: glycosyltransferase family 2 protein [Burkholderiaceae bacterium]|nr:glycosyltransferase family 2 protein [Burkholderiaceae bacterium]